MISRIALRWRYLRRVVSRNVWSARSAGTKPPRDEAADPGLIMVQIDGLTGLALAGRWLKRRFGKKVAV